MAAAIIILGMLGFLLFLGGAVQVFFIGNWKQSIYTMCLGFGFFLIGIFLGMNSRMLRAATRTRRRKKLSRIRHKSD